MPLSPHPFGIPRRFRFFDETWRVEWRVTASDFFDPQKDDAAYVLAERLVIINREVLTWRDPVTRRPDPSYAWECFLHEVMHLVDELWPKRRGKNDRRGRKRSRWSLSHKTLHRLDEPLGRFIVEAGASIACVCRRCVRPVA